MKALYARAVLWLIRPALELRDQANRERYAVLNEAIKQVYESLGTSAKAGMNALVREASAVEEAFTAMQMATIKPPASAADEPVFTGIAKGKAGWFEEATESLSPAASEDATPLPPEPTNSSNTCPCGAGELIAYRFIESARDQYLCRPSSGACTWPDPARAEALRSLSRESAATGCALVVGSSAECSPRC